MAYDSRATKLDKESKRMSLSMFKTTTDSNFWIQQSIKIIRDSVYLKSSRNRNKGENNGQKDQH